MSGFSFAVGKKKTPFQVLLASPHGRCCGQLCHVRNLSLLQKHKEQEEEKKRVRIRPKSQRPVHNHDVTCRFCICIPHQGILLQKEALEAAKLYEDFVESFAEDPAEKGPKAFVRGEVIQPGQRPSDSGLACHLLSLPLIR